MQPAETPVGVQEEPGLSAEAASFAVLGVDIEDLGVAVVRYWGLGSDVQQMIRRVPDRATVHPPESDNDILRLAGCCANDLIDAAGLPPRRAQAAMRKVAQRYARALGTSGREMQEALQAETNGKPITASGLGISDTAVVDSHGLATPHPASGASNRGVP
jgi:non-specific serine/threonine protein kinase